MDSNKKKKREEVRFLNIFSTLSADYPSGRVECSESPDFIIHSGARRYGVEITKAIKLSALSTNQKAKESEHDSLLNQVRTLYIDRGLPPIQASVYLGGDSNIDKRSRKDYAATIVNLIESALPTQNGVVSVDNDFNDPIRFPFEVSSFRIARYDFNDTSVISMPGAGWVSEDCTKDIQYAIDKKNELVKGYQPCDSQWLIVVADWSAPSSYFEPSEGALATEYHSYFDSVYFLNVIFQKSFKLKTRNAAP